MASQVEEDDILNTKRSQGRGIYEIWEGVGRTHVEICVARTFGGTFEERRLFPFLPLLTSDPRASSASNGPKSYPLRTCHHQQQHIDGVEWKRFWWWSGVQWCPMNEAGCWALPDKWADSATVGLYPHNTYPLTDPLLPGYSCINRTNEDHLSGIVPIETI